MPNDRPKFPVGINVFVKRGDKFLLGKRKTFGAGTWGLPGGHLEKEERIAKEAARELFEETGLKPKILRFDNLVNDRFNPTEPYLQIGFIAESFKGEPKLKEPDKCAEWRWFDAKHLPKNLFAPHAEQIRTFIAGLNFSDK